jgi:hypothetical protein
MTPEQMKLVPTDLSAREYGMKICEDLMWPQVPSNIQLVLEAITAIAKGKLCRDRRRPAFSAYLYLDKQIENAQRQGIVVDGFFFRDGGYTRVPALEKLDKADYKPPTKEELQNLAAWKASPEYAEIRNEWLALDAKLDLKRAIKRKDPKQLIPALPPDQEKAKIAKYLKK